MIPDRLKPRDLAIQLLKCTNKELAEVFAYYYESTKFFEEELDAKVTDQDILNLNAHECGKIIRDSIVYAAMEIIEEREKSVSVK